MANPKRKAIKEGLSSVADYIKKDTFALNLQCQNQIREMTGDLDESELM